MRLIEAMAKPGCPVCRCLSEDSVRHLGVLIYEHVTDPGVRAALRASRGFCGWHAALLTGVSDAGFGTAIIARDLLGLEIARLERSDAGRDRAGRGQRLGRLLRRAGAKSPAPAGHRGAVCPVCRSLADAERRHLAALLGLDGDARLADALERSDPLCLPHLEQVLQGGEDAAAVRRLASRTIAKWRSLSAALGAFVAKQDHRRPEPITDVEAESWQKALEVLAGSAAIFGSDLVRARAMTPHSGSP